MTDNLVKAVEILAKEYRQRQNISENQTLYETKHMVEKAWLNGFLVGKSQDHVVQQAGCICPAGSNIDCKATFCPRNGVMHRY